MTTMIKKTLDKLFHDFAIADLRLQNADTTLLNMTFNDLLYLDMIESHPGFYTASKIADVLYVSRPAVTQKIKDLEKKGYVYKVQSESDKRIHYLFPNLNNYSDLYKETMRKREENIALKLQEKYTKEQVELFCEMTNEISEMILTEKIKGEV